MRSIFGIACVMLVATSCDLKKKKTHHEVVDSASLSMKCKEIGALIVAAEKEENFDPLAKQTCLNDVDCTSSPDTMSCSVESCMIGCNIPRNRENDTKAKKLLKNKKYKSAEAALNKSSGRCAKMMPTCTPGELYCDKTQKVCSWNGKAP